MRLSLKWKITLSLIAVPMVSLLIFLGASYISFKEDRLAYIYESSLSQSRLLSKFATEKLSVHLSLAEQWAALFAANPEQNQEQVRNLIQTSNLRKEYREIYFVLYNTKMKTTLNQFFAFGASAKSKIPLFLNDIDNLLARFEKQKKHLFLENSDPDLWTMFSVFPAYDDLSVLVFFNLENRWTKSKFPGQIVSESIWINDQGNILTMHKNLKVNSLKSTLNSALNAKSSAGSYMTQIEGINYIASFSFPNQFAIFPVTLIKVSSAYESVDILLEKSIILLCMLISAAGLIGLTTGKKLTASLEYLLLATQSIAKGKFDTLLQMNSSDEVGTLAKSFNVMNTEIQKLIIQNKEAGRMEAELNLAKTVQDEINPNNNYYSPILQLEAYSQAASECSGDWWTYFETDEDFFVLIGDATGHGASAALFTSAINSLIILLKNMNIVKSPKECLQFINNALYETAKGKKSITIVFLKINKQTGQLTYANASHEQPLIFRNLTEKTRAKDIDCLPSDPSEPLGFLPNSTYSEGSFLLEKDDVILLYTDGFPECSDADNEMWGERKFVNGAIESLRNEANLNYSLKAMLNKFETHRKNHPLKDDITIIMLKFNP
jgi:sigma-B regulation protein RsbU (phosphoserine phosphatase)